ncbi:hypothetical protein AMELA_G00148060, partial [Ameiurus melas]
LPQALPPSHVCRTFSFTSFPLCFPLICPSCLLISCSLHVCLHTSLRCCSFLAVCAACGDVSLLCLLGLLGCSRFSSTKLPACLSPLPDADMDDKEEEPREAALWLCCASHRQPWPAPDLVVPP